MRLGEIWDYFMRQKLLLLLVIAVSTFVGAMSYKLCFGQNEAKVIGVPKTGEIMIPRNEASCVADLVDSGDGSGEYNRSEPEVATEETDAEITFWGAEAPDTNIEIMQAESDSNTEAKAETLIIVAGAIAVVAVIFLAKFIFDHYVR